MIGLTVSDAFRPMMVQIAAEKRLPFEPLLPNDETIEAMKAARCGELAAVGGVDDFMGPNLMRTIRRTAALERNYKRKRKGIFAKTLDAEAASVVGHGVKKKYDSVI